MYATVAIAGVGLLGGSLGLALRRRGLARRVVGIARREETLREALALGALDSGGTSPEAAAGAELLILAVPVLAAPPLLADLASHLAPGALVTDVGSTKEAVLAALLAELPPGAELIGGHPMAGSEREGVGNAREDLYEGATWVLSPTLRSSEAGLRRLEQLVAALGASPLRMEACAHDEAVARVSHLPHVAASALAQAVLRGRADTELLSRLAAGGYRDTTRIAGAKPEMWRDICLTNRAALQRGLADLEAALAEFRQALQEADPARLEAFFADGRAAREVVHRPDRSGS